MMWREEERDEAEEEDINVHLWTQTANFVPYFPVG
jgi:hypothetical protein